MTEVEAIKEELKEMHTQHSAEQVRSWAHLIQLKSIPLMISPLHDKRFWRVAESG